MRTALLPGTLVVLLSSIVSAHADDGPQMAGVISPEQAEYHWVLHCQGCHGVDAQGSKDGAPEMKGTLARFLQQPRGRAYLARVPGVAFVALPDADVAQLLNWIVQRFDATQVPRDFRPYTVDEVRALREDPLISRAAEERRMVLQDPDDDSPL